MPPDLDVSVKRLYQGVCAITKTSTSWGVGMFSGPARQSCHIVPKAMYRWYPAPDSTPELDLWNRTNSLENCILLDSSVHCIHDLRLVAIHHVCIPSRPKFRDTCADKTLGLTQDPNLRPHRRVSPAQQ